MPIVPWIATVPQWLLGAAAGCPVHEKMLAELLLAPAPPCLLGRPLLPAVTPVICRSFHYRLARPVGEGERHPGDSARSFKPCPPFPQFAERQEGRQPHAGDQGEFNTQIYRLAMAEGLERFPPAWNCGWRTWGGWLPFPARLSCAGRSPAGLGPPRTSVSPIPALLRSPR